MVLLAGTLTFTTSPRADAQVSQSLISAPSPSYHYSAKNLPTRSSTDDISTLSGVLSDSLGNAVSGATIDVDPAGTSCTGAVPAASTTTGPGGSFSVPVSPGSYDVRVSYPGDSTDPDFLVCTAGVDLSASVADALTLPVTQLTVTAEDSSGDPVQGATVKGNSDIQLQQLAEFDLVPGQPASAGYPTSSPTGTSRPMRRAPQSFRSCR
jgi:hypothetical protein